jgi:hypothetical protein
MDLYEQVTHMKIIMSKGVGEHLLPLLTWVHFTDNICGWSFWSCCTNGMDSNSGEY